MKQFKLFKTDKGVIEAVKQGWSWPAFFFHVIWALIKRLWSVAGITIAACLAIGIVAVASGQAENEWLNIFGFGVNVLFAIRGNLWREENLRSRGYRFVETVTASNAEGAVALHANDRVKG